MSLGLRSVASTINFIAICQALYSYFRDSKLFCPYYFDHLETKEDFLVA